MKSISVHGVDTETEKTIKERAKNEGKSVNKVMKELVAQSLGITGRPPDNRAEYADLSGVWTEEQASEFMELIADLEVVDAKDWR